MVHRISNLVEQQINYEQSTGYYKQPDLVDEIKKVLIESAQLATDRLNKQGKEWEDEKNRHEFEDKVDKIENLEQIKEALRYLYLRFKNPYMPFETFSEDDEKSDESEEEDYLLGMKVWQKRNVHKVRLWQGEVFGPSPLFKEMLVKGNIEEVYLGALLLLIAVDQINFKKVPKNKTQCVICGQNRCDLECGKCGSKIHLFCACLDVYL